MPLHRQLAAIMFTDIVGYTALMGKDEKKAFELLKKNRELQKPIVEQFNGRWIKELGDGVLVSFNTVTDAVTAALKIQNSSNTENIFSLRIGIHQGEVVFDQDDVFGDAVNIASRIQAIAKPGCIYISETVQHNVSNKNEIKTRFVKEELLKNVKESIKIYEVITSRSNDSIVIPDLGIKRNCIAVLPFTNMSSDPEQEYFSDGLTEELISSLSRIKEIRVLSRTTSMKYKGTKKDVKTIVQETGARYIMEGSVRKHGNNLRITAQFVDANLDVELWSETFSGTMDDIFEMQEKVATKIVAELKKQLSNEDKNIIQKHFTENTLAYQLYLRGRYFWNKRNETDLNKAITYFEKAIATDPDFALAWSGLADSYHLLGEFTNYSRRELSPKFKAAVTKALELDNNLAEAHISHASFLMINEWDWVNSEKEYKRGIELKPNYSTGHHWYCELLLYTGRPDEAIREITLAVELDPISQGILKDQGMAFYYTKQYDKAIDIANLTLELDPNFITAHRLLSMSYAGKKMFDMAYRENKLWGDQIKNTIKFEIAQALINALEGKKEEAIKLLDKNCDENNLGNNDFRGIALVYAALKENDKAFEWLEKSFMHHEESLCSLSIDPKLDTLRADPRFEDLLRRIGL